MCWFLKDWQSLAQVTGFIALNMMAGVLADTW